MQKRVWITWENQRRSLELAKKLGCDLFVIEYNGLLRYPKSIYKTIAILLRTKPDILFVQNPSMILAALACVYKTIKKIPLVIDRHTTFLLNKKTSITPYFIVFKALHRFTIRCADLTIVTNNFLANLVKELNGRPFVLPDKIPELKKTTTIKLKGKHNILYISSFGVDEPITEVLEAMKSPNMKDTILYITGDYKGLDNSILHSAPSNVIFTGFLEEQEFINMLFSVDAVIVLTTADYTMLCGCYEAVSASKPLITSNKEVLMNYFKDAVFVDNTPKGILEGINEIYDHLEDYRERMYRMKKQLTIKWNAMYEGLESKIGKLGE